MVLADAYFQRFMGGDFEADYDPTIEESYRRNLDFGYGSVLLEILDIAGAVSFDTT